MVLAAHGHSDSLTPANTPMVEFQNWTNFNELFHLPTAGSTYTWSNGGLNQAHT